MRDFLTSGQVGNIELNEQRKIRQQITERWDKLGMTEGLKGLVKENIATLYENEAKQLLSEATVLSRLWYSLSSAVSSANSLLMTSCLYRP